MLKDDPWQIVANWAILLQIVISKLQFLFSLLVSDFCIQTVKTPNLDVGNEQVRHQGWSFPDDNTSGIIKINITSQS